MSEVAPKNAVAPGLKTLDAVIRFAGHSQDGIQTIGGMLARLAGRTDQDVMTYMTIPSTISGGPSIFQVRLGSGEVLSAGDETDVLVAFYQQSFDDHIGSLKRGGVCLYDKDEVKPDPKHKGFTLVGVPLTSATVEAVGGSRNQRGKNMFALGLICSIFDLDREKMAAIVARSFQGKHESVLRTALQAFDAGFAYPVGDVLGTAFSLQRDEPAGAAARVTTDGNTALALGLIAAGVRFGAAYPITPWSSVMEILRTELPKYGGSFIQAEDELAAVSMALGFAYSGHLAVTGSSGPGLSLKMEALGWATMAEMPLIVINVQRGGPSTGLPTNVEQSDLLQAIYGSHGDCPRVVMAPKDVEDCFYMAIQAGQVARRYGSPVVLLTDQALATRIEAFEMPDLEKLVQEPAVDLSPRTTDFKPYPLKGTVLHAPPGSRMEGGRYPVVTGLEHDEWGHPSASPELHQAMTERRREKLKRLESGLLTPEVFGDATGEILLVGWGSTWGPIREAVQKLRAKRYRASSIHIRHLHPLAPGLGDVLERFDSVFVVEMNDDGVYGFGQLATLLRARFCNPRIRSICKANGLAFKVSEIIAGIDRHVAVSV